jgi:hypothetical protein
MNEKLIKALLKSGYDKETICTKYDGVSFNAGVKDGVYGLFLYFDGFGKPIFRSADRLDMNLFEVYVPATVESWSKLVKPMEKITIIYPNERIFTFERQMESSQEKLLESIFAEWNNGSQNESEIFLSMRVRSLSVGDIVGIEDRFFKCASSGWSEVTVDLSSFKSKVKVSLDFL